MRRAVLVAVVALLAGAAVAVAGLTAGRQAARAKPVAALKPMQRRLLSGVARQSLDRTLRPSLAPRLRAERRAPGSTSETGCPADRGSNVRVNQDCQNLTDPDLAGRGEAQNETAIAQDPNDPSRVVAFNDYRRGDGNCYVLLRRDGGRCWQDRPAHGVHPRHDFGVLARQYWQAGGDTSVALDTKGNAYLSCQMFMRGQAVTNNPDQSSAFYVFRSTGTGGASWNFPARPVAELNEWPGRRGAPRQAVHDRGRPRRQPVPGPHLHDVDALRRPTGPPTSTRPTRATSVSIQRAEAGERGRPLCATPGCRHTSGSVQQNQFSSPFTGPDGALYVAWDNYNHDSARRGRRGRRRGRREPGRRAGWRRQPSGSPREVDGRRETVLRPGEGRRLLRPPGLRHVPGRRRRAGLRPEKGEHDELDVPGHELPVGRRGPTGRRARSTSPSAPTSTATRTSGPTAACCRGIV